jgi:hypothetical protein
MEKRNDPKDLDWLQEFQDLADEQLGDGSACEQVHPIIEQWLDELLDGDPPDSRDSVWQAMACLTTEIMYKATPEDLQQVLQANFDEQEVMAWVEGVLLIGRAFQMALDQGRLDDL